jgi:DNA-directed RNA polymerase specialized sigma24 family protein
MPDQSEWETKASNFLKAELKRAGVSYAELAERIGDKEPNVRNKLSRGKFSAAYLFQCLDSLGVTDLRLG